MNPGEDKTVCTFLRGTNETPVDISAFIADQPVGGHHVIVYAVDHPIDATPAECTQGGQPGWDTLLISQQQHEEVVFPQGVGYHIDARQQFVVETHYINTSPVPIDAASRFGMVYAKAGEVTQRAATYYFGTMNIDIEPNSKATSAGSCSPPVPMAVHNMFAHQHRMGNGLDVSLIHGDGGAPTDLYHSTEWENAPVATFEPAIVVGTDDRLLVTCGWENTGHDRLRYPQEMCFAIGYFWPAPSSFTCVSGGGGADDECTCFARGGLDVGTGGGSFDLAIHRAAEVPGAGGPIDDGGALYCFLYAPEDYGPAGPNQGARPLYFRDAQGVVLASPETAATISFNDVTPGTYVVSCMMDVVGGGFVAGSGDIVNATPTTVTVELGKAASADVTLDFAMP